MVKPSKQQLAAEFEQRTGQRTNMRELGYRPGALDAQGQPTGYTAVCPYQIRIGRVTLLGAPVIRRTLNRRWRIEIENRGMGKVSTAGRGCFYPARKVVSPVFSNPIAAALWLRVEVENGGISFAEGEGAAGPIRSVLRYYPAQPGSG